MVSGCCEKTFFNEHTADDYFNDVLQGHSAVGPRSGELRTQKLNSHLFRTQSLNVLPLKTVVGQYIAIHAALTARDFFLAYFYPYGPFAGIFSKTSPDFSCVGCG